MKEIIKNLYIYENEVNNDEFSKIVNNESINNNFGANIIFNGIIRNDNNIDGLKFKIYEPLVIAWFKKWQEIAIKNNCQIALAHSNGFVKVGFSSYSSAMFAKHRKDMLKLFPDFIEDFKHNCPIWKFEVKDNKEIYLKEQSNALPFSGILGESKMQDCQVLHSQMDIVNIGVIVASDRAFHNIYEDKSGIAIKEVLSAFIKNKIIFHYKIVPDDVNDIMKIMREMSSICDLVVTTGGTGPAMRDVTVEATEKVVQKIMPGFGELMRNVSLQYVKTAILSRQTAGILNKTLIVNLPGKPKSIQECLEAIFPAIPYCIDLIGGKFIVANEEKITAFRPKNN